MLQTRLSAKGCKNVIKVILMNENCMCKVKKYIKVNLLAVTNGSVRLSVSAIESFIKKSKRK